MKSKYEQDDYEKSLPLSELTDIHAIKNNLQEDAIIEYHQQKIKKGENRKASISKILTRFSLLYILFSVVVMLFTIITNGNFRYIDEALILGMAILLNPVAFISEIVAAILTKGSQRNRNLIFIGINIIILFVLIFFLLCVFISRA